MKKFMFIYTADISAENRFDEMTPDAIEAMTKSWFDWEAKAGSAILDFGGPTLAVGGTAPGIGGYSFMQAEAYEDLIPLIEVHPHKMMGGRIDVYEVIPPPV